MLGQIAFARSIKAIGTDTRYKLSSKDSILKLLTAAGLQQQAYRNTPSFVKEERGISIR